MIGADGAPAAEGPLARVRVLDLTDLRGALCGRILADLGADVVKLVAPSLTAAEMSTPAFLYRNANKRAVVVDLHSGAGREQFDRRAEDADVVIENFGVRLQAEHGLDPERIRSRHRHLVQLSLSDCGLDGERARWHLEPLCALAAAGTLWATGFRDRPPVGLPGFLAHDCASVYGAAGVIAALADRARHGEGQLVEVSVQEAALAGTWPWSIPLADYVEQNPALDPTGRRSADGAYWVLPAKDGWVRTVIGTPRQWEGFVELCGRPEALLDPAWTAAGFRAANVDVLRLLAQECLTDRTRAELLAQSLQLSTTLGVLHLPLEFVEHPQTRHRGFFTATGFPGLGDAPFAVAPFRLSATPCSLRGPFRLSANDTVDWTAPAMPRPSARPTASPPENLLLRGLKVVEFGMAAVVPELCGVLSELGADVVKVESHTAPDVLRLSRNNLNANFTFNSEARGRRSVAIDLSSMRGRELARALCAQADVVAENFRGGVLDRLGFGYDDVRAMNPSVIYVSSQGYGRGGPYGEMPAFGPLNAGFAGLHHLWSEADGPYPCGTSLNHPDHIAGKLESIAVLAALDHRRRSGEGQHIEMAQTEAAAYLIGEIYLEAALRGVELPERGSTRTAVVPHNVYRCAGDDAWVAIVAPDDAAWSRLARLAGIDEPVWSTAAARVAARNELDRRIGEWTATRTNHDVAAALQDAGVSAMPVMGPVDHHADRHLAQREFIVTLHHAEVGEEHHVGNPLRFSRLAQRRAAAAPCLGADTESVLVDWLGLDRREITELVAAQVCY